MVKPARPADRGASLVLAAVEPGEDPHQADGVHVPDAGPGRVVADARRIAGQGQDVPDAQRVRPEQLRLEGHQVPVAGREVDDALEVHVVLDPEGDRQGSHADARHRRVADVDAVGPGRGEEACRLDGPLDPDGAGRVDLDGDDVAAGTQLPEERGRSRGVAGCVDPLELDPRRRRGARRLHQRGPPPRARDRRAGRAPGPDRRVHRRAHRGDVRRRRPAAAAHDPGTRRQREGHDRAEPGRVRRIHELALDPLRQPRVGHERAGQPEPPRVHASQRIERRARADAAVDADHVDACVRKHRRRFLRRPAVGEAQLFAERHRRHDGEAGRGPGFADRQEELVEVVERLQDQQVHPAFQEAIELLAEDRPRGRVPDTQVAVRRPAQGPDRPRHQGIAPGDVTGLARELRRPPVQPRGDLPQAPAGQPNAVGPEGRRLHDVRACVQVLAVDRADEVRARRGPARPGRRAAGSRGRRGACRWRRRRRAAERRGAPGTDRAPTCGPAPDHPPRSSGAWYPHGASGLPEWALAPRCPGRGQPSEPSRPRRRASVSEPSASTNTSGGRGRPLYADRIDAP